MNEGLTVESPASGIEPQENDMKVDGDVNTSSADALAEGSRAAVRGNDVERSPVLAAPPEDLAPLDSPVATDDEAPPVKHAHGDTKMDFGGALEEPPVDWIEPLEEDDEVDENDAQSFDLDFGEKRTYGRREAEEESLAGESERSGSVAGSEKTFKKRTFKHVSRGKRTKPEEGWEDWPPLGVGWMRKTVVRRSGSSIGQEDVYYMSPSGERVRSRVELSKTMGPTVDMTMFEYRSGVFGQARPIRGYVRRKKSPSAEGGFSSESSWIDKGDRADTPKPATTSPTAAAHRHQSTKLPWRPTSNLSSSINGKAGSETCICICSKCGISYTGSVREQQRKKSCCPKCKAKTVGTRKPYKKCLPCGQCTACLATVDCGKCANCRNAMLNPDSRKPVRCRKRKCRCPIRKNKPETIPQVFEPVTYFQNERVESQNSSHQNSDTEDFSMYVDGEDEDDDIFDGDEDEYEAWARKRKRRSCGKCDACLSRKDCGTCDFCFDKPKFGGSNKKRQKCRLRQCRNHAMRHLLPFQLGQTEFGTPEGGVQHARQRVFYRHTYSRKKTPQTNKALTIGLAFTDEQEEDGRTVGTGQKASSSKPYHQMHFGNHQQRLQVTSVEPFLRNGLPDSVPIIHNYSLSSASDAVSVRKADSLLRQESPSVPPQGGLNGGDGGRPAVDQGGDMRSKNPDQGTPKICQIYSLADSTASAPAAERDPGLLQLMQSLRISALPTLWFSIMVDGPRLQLLQCCKLSPMADTVVQIAPGFSYQISVQGQPLLLTHPLYERHAARLDCVARVVTLLLDLERYRVCQGAPIKELPLVQTPLICERASTCDFLVQKHVECCNECKSLSCE